MTANVGTSTIVPSLKNTGTGTNEMHTRHAGTSPMIIDPIVPSLKSIGTSTNDVSTRHASTSPMITASAPVPKLFPPLTTNRSLSAFPPQELAVNPTSRLIVNVPLPQSPDVIQGRPIIPKFQTCHLLCRLPAISHNDGEIEMIPARGVIGKYRFHRRKPIGWKSKNTDMILRPSENAMVTSDFNFCSTKNQSTKTPKSPHTPMPKDWMPPTPVWSSPTYTSLGKHGRQYEATTESLNRYRLLRDMNKRGEFPLPRRADYLCGRTRRATHIPRRLETASQREQADDDAHTS